MVVDSDDEAPVEAPTRYMLVRNHVREVQCNLDDPDLPRHESDLPPNQTESSNDQSELEKDIDDLRRAYSQCKRLLRKIEQKYGDQLELQTEQEEPSPPPNKKIRFDDSGLAVHIEHRDPLVLPDDIMSLCQLLRSKELDGVIRRAAVFKLRMLRNTLAEEMRYERKALQERLSAGASDELGFVGTNLLELPGYHYTKKTVQ